MFSFWRLSVSGLKVRSSCGTPSFRHHFSLMTSSKNHLSLDADARTPFQSSAWCHVHPIKKHEPSSDVPVRFSVYLLLLFSGSWGGGLEIEKKHLDCDQFDLCRFNHSSRF